MRLTHKRFHDVDVNFGFLFLVLTTTDGINGLFLFHSTSSSLDSVLIAVKKLCTESCALSESHRVLQSVINQHL